MNEAIERLMKRRRLDALVVCGEANLRRLLGFACDNGVLVVSAKSGRAGSVPSALQSVFFTDFRYAPEARRKCRGLKVRDIRGLALSGRRIGYEGFIPHSRFLRFAKLARRAKFVDVERDLLELRAVKTPEEIVKLRAAETLACDIYEQAIADFEPGMTEREMASLLKIYMVDAGDGEAFDTIVCIGRNAAECHHVPDDTVWNGRDPVLIDMGVKLDGYCSDMTRNILPGEFRRNKAGRLERRRPDRKAPGLYGKVHALVKAAHDAAIAAARPGITGRQLDRIARDVIRKGGFGKCFGHSLGHGVGLEIHEAPNASRKSDWTLKPGMVVTIEPGIYLEDNLGVRIEDLILITEDGCEVLSR